MIAQLFRRRSEPVAEPAPVKAETVLREGDVVKGPGGLFKVTTGPGGLVVEPLPDSTAGRNDAEVTREKASGICPLVLERPDGETFRVADCRQWWCAVWGAALHGFEPTGCHSLMLPTAHMGRYTPEPYLRDARSEIPHGDVKSLASALSKTLADLECQHDTWRTIEVDDARLVPPPGAPFGVQGHGALRVHPIRELVRRCKDSDGLTSTAWYRGLADWLDASEGPVTLRNAEGLDG